jgi:MFS family permease
MKHNRKIIYLAGFIFSIPIALTSYINSSFLENYLNAYYVSILYVIASILTIWGLSEISKVLTRFGNRRATILFSFIIFLSLIILAFTDKVFVAIGAFILYFIASNLIIATLDIFIEDFSKSGTIGRFRGFYLTIINSAWIIAQVISGSIIAKSSFRGIYLLSALFMLLVAVIFILFLHNFIDPKYKKVPILKTFKLFMQNKNISKIYLINLILKFFYAWMIIYTPIYLNQYLGFSWDQIGIIFSIMLLPFVILEFPLGKLSDKMGERKMLIWGSLIIALFTLIIPLINQQKLWVWAAVLFATRIGAAIIEVMSESYFFKIINEENADVISFFRNTNSLSYIIAPLLAIPILFFVPSFEYLFYILSAIMLLGLLLSLRLKDVK